MLLPLSTQQNWQGQVRQLPTDPITRTNRGWGLRRGKSKPRGKSDFPLTIPPPAESMFMKAREGDEIEFTVGGAHDDRSEFIRGDERD